MDGDTNPLSLTILGSAIDFSKVYDVPLGAVVRNEGQPRTEFDADEMQELIASIRKFGQKDTAFVVPRSDGTYLMISGERRWLALQEAASATIRVHLCRRELTVDETYFLSCHGNAKQVEQSAYDNVVMIQTLIVKGLTHEQIAALTSRSVSWVEVHANIAVNLDVAVLEMMRSSREKNDRIFLEEASKILSMAPEIQMTAARVIVAAKKKGGGQKDQRAAFQVFLEQSEAKNSRGHAAKRTINGQLLDLFTRLDRDLGSFVAAPEGIFLSNLRQSGLDFLANLLARIDAGKKRAGVIETALQNLPLLELAQIVAEVDKKTTTLRDLVQRAHDTLQERK